MKKRHSPLERTVAAWLACTAVLVVSFAFAAPASDQPRPVVVGSPDRPEDWYFREEVRWERFVLFFRTASKVRAVHELWIGDGRAAYFEPDRRVILDRHRNTFTFINPRERTYVELDLPLDLSTALCEHLIEERRSRRFGAEVEPTGKKRKIHGYNCDEYRVTQWQEEDGRRENFSHITVWATTEIEADYSLVEELLDNLRKVLPRSQRAVEELRKIRGLQLRLEIDGPESFLVRERVLSEDVELGMRTPRPEVYSVPAGYKRKEQLTLDDF